MNNVLITSDLHLTDVELEAYRWKIFDVLATLAVRYNVEDIFLTGDVWDRKDRHTAKLLHNTIFKLLALQERTDAQIWITAGNHDEPINGPHYWKILDYIKTEDSLGRFLCYITKPNLYHNVWLLPFSSNPVVAWKDLRLSQAKAILMHQTIEGAIVDGDRKIPKTPHPLPKLPEGIPIFSGDVHRPQSISNITYIGTPYPIRFSESWSNRVILIQKNDWENFTSIPVDIMKRAIVEINSSKQLENITFNEGNQIRVRYKLTGNKLTDWPIEENKIREWCNQKGITLVSLEASFEGNGLQPEKNNEQKIELLSPEELIKMFCKDEKVTEDVLEMGLTLIKESV